MRRGLQLRRQAILIALAAFALQGVARGTGFQPGRADFSVQVREKTIPYRVSAVFVMPGESLRISVSGDDSDSWFELQASGGTLVAESGKSWHWKAPETSGLNVIRIHRTADPDSVLINVFVKVPSGEATGNHLNSYTIGKYPATPLDDSPLYEPPPGFIEVTEANQETWLSPHFQLKQFLCKQPGSYPKYVVLHERLLLVLQRILEEINAAGYRCGTLHIMSGYRTPSYNRSLGNVPYSCHLYGLAVDFFIDENPRDGIMDDLNGDGRSDIRDVALIQDLILKLFEDPSFEKFQGGLAKYGPTASRGPFLHVDVRGKSARWGR